MAIPEVNLLSQFVDTFHGQPVPQGIHLVGNPPKDLVIMKAGEVVADEDTMRKIIPSAIFLRHKEPEDNHKNCYIMVFCRAGDELVGVVGMVFIQDLRKDPNSFFCEIDSARSTGGFWERGEFAYMAQTGKWARPRTDGISDPVGEIPKF